MSRTTIFDTAVDLPGGSAAALRPLSGREEEWLAAHGATANAFAVTHLLGACLVALGAEAPSAAAARELLVGDRDALMLALRRITIGEKVLATFACACCREPMDIDFELGDLPFEGPPQAVREHVVTAGGGSIRFRLPTGADQEAVAGLPLPEAAEALLDRCLLQPAAPEDRAAVAEAIERLAPKLDVELELTCPECGTTSVEAFDLTAFFFSELALDGRGLLREVHDLAIAHAWSEAEILELPRPRRRAYLELLDAAV